jgi:hypothetical protein
MLETLFYGKRDVAENTVSLDHGQKGYSHLILIIQY